MMSSQTQQAIREFQYLNNLPVTGNVDAQTKIAIDTQWNSGIQNAQVSQQPFSSDFGREKPGMTTQQNQTQTSTSTSTSSSSQKDKTYGTTTDRDRSHSDSDTTKSSAKADVRDKDKDKYAKEHSSGKSEKDASERISKAAAVLQDLTAASDKKLPNELLERSEAIAVIPNMIKGALGIGGRFGKGVISQRDASGRWSAPAFIEIGGGSFGAQIGVSSTDLVLVFTDRKGLNMLEGGKDLKLGVDAGIVAGPIGRSAEAGVNAKLESAIYAYSRSKGLFAGVALDGAVLNMDKSMNEKVYGASVDAKQILDGQVAANTTVRPFVDALDKSVPKKHLTQK